MSESKPSKSEKNICTNCLKEVKYRIKIETDDTFNWDNREWKSSIFLCLKCLKEKMDE